MHEWSGVGMHVCVCVCLCVYECVWVCVACLGRKQKVSGGATDLSVCNVLLFARPLPSPAAPWSPIWL